jgi:transcriptional regulator of met regulon
MKRIIHRAAVALVGVLVPAMLSVGAASASTPSYGGAGAAGDHNATAQGAKAKSTSVQVLPINANVPISVLSFGSNDGSVHQSNNSIAASNAENKNFTLQGQGEAMGPRSESCARPEASGSDPGSPNQGSGDHNATAQGTKAKSTSVQVLPVNANVPISVLSAGSNNGSVHQSNNSIAAPNAENKNFTLQGGGTGRGGEMPSWRSDNQGSGDRNATAQGAEAKSTSVQVLPINANVPISVLSAGSNNGSVHQSNNSIAASNAENKNFTLQGQGEAVGPRSESCGAPGQPGPFTGQPGFSQEAGPRNATAQWAEAKSTSVQVLPVNANVPISVLSGGSNNGSVHQSNNSIAAPNAHNSNFTGQAVGPHLG